MPIHRQQSVLSTVGDIQRFAAACVRYANEASDYTFSVTFGDSFDRSSRDGSGNRFFTYRKGKNVVINVPNPKASMSEHDATILKAGILHEILHTTEGTLDKSDLIDDCGIGKLEPNDPMFQIFNILEDHRIERLDCKKFDGDARVLGDAYRTLSNEFAEKLKHMPEGTLEEAGEKLLALRSLDLVAREEWLNMGDATENTIKAQPEAVNKILNDLCDEHIDDEMRQLDTVEDVIDYTKKLFEKLFEQDAEEHIEQNAKQQGDGDEEGEGEGQGQAEGEGDPDGEGDGKATRPRLTEGELDYLEYLRRKQHMPTVDGDSGKSGADMHIDYDNYFDSLAKGDRYEFDPCPMNELLLINYGTKKVVPPATPMACNIETTWGINAPSASAHRVTTRRSRQEQLNHTFDKYRFQVSGMANKIRRLLQVHAQARWIGGATQGRLHRKSVYRAAMPTIGDGRYNREIFKRRHKNDTLDVAVSVLCDFSGSMGGSKMTHATFGGFILGDSIGRVLGVPIQITTFTEYENHTVLCVLKNWSERVNETEFIERASNASNVMSQNDDGSAILATYLDLLKRPEKRKVMIVLSDGSPASSRHGDAMGYTIRVVRDIEESGIVDIYGIGIMDENVTRIYKEHSTIEESNELEEAILNTVKRKLMV